MLVVLCLIVGDWLVVRVTVGYAPLPASQVAWAIGFGSLGLGLQIAALNQEDRHRLICSSDGGNP